MPLILFLRFPSTHVGNIIILCPMLKPPNIMHPQPSEFARMAQVCGALLGVFGGGANNTDTIQFFYLAESSGQDVLFNSTFETTFKNQVRHRKPASCFELLMLTISTKIVGVFHEFNIGQMLSHPRLLNG